MFMTKGKNKDTQSDKMLYIINATLISVFIVLVLYPLIYILSSSFSSPKAIASGRVIFLPVDFSLDGYRAVFTYKKVVTGYVNTLLYTGVGTVINISLTMITAYPMAMPRFQGKRIYMFLFSFTMFFSGGLVPTYLLISDLKLINTFWVMVIPGAMSIYNLIVARSFIQNSIPVELLEASQIDGCSWTQYFFSIVLPLSKAVIAVLVLYYAVAHWNSYFDALMYLNDWQKFPLQLVLREILIESKVEAIDLELEAARADFSNLLKYGLIVVSTVPILCVYPFIQKYFMKGVMIGSLKG